MTIYNLLFNCNYVAKKSLWLFGLFFPVLTIFVGGLDSVYFTKNYFDARQIVNLLVIIYCCFFFFFADFYLRKLIFVMVFLSYIGELLFCEVLHLYDYRTNTIPLYVPFGHAIVYASGYVLSQTTWVNNKDLLLKKCFAIGFALLFLSVAFFLNDVFSLIFGLCFFLILKRKRWQNLYYCIALCVIFIELAGTYFQCWTWKPKAFGLIPTANPPMGAVFFYAGGDVLLMKIVDIWYAKRKKKLLKIQIK